MLCCNIATLCRIYRGIRRQTETLEETVAVGGYGFEFALCTRFAFVKAFLPLVLFCLCFGKGFLLLLYAVNAAVHVAATAQKGVGAFQFAVLEQCAHALLESVELVVVEGGVVRRHRFHYFFVVLAFFVEL